MDTLVARYSRPAALQHETFGEDQQDDLANDMAPALSLKFAIPPVAQVRKAASSSSPSSYSLSTKPTCYLPFPLPPSKAKATVH